MTSPGGLGVRSDYGPVVDLAVTGEVQDACDLFEEVIAGVVGASVTRPGEQMLGPRRLFAADWVDLWRGVHRGDELVAAVHVASSVDYLDALLPQVDAGEVSEDWLRAFYRECVLLQELAVSRSARGLGLGRELLTCVEGAAEDCGVRFLNGFVSDQNGTANFYKRCGYAVGLHNDPLPPGVLNGLPSIHPIGAEGHWFFKPLGDHGERGRLFRAAVEADIRALRDTRH
jgi:GNAT superfamily N-acetyltransferase